MRDALKTLEFDRLLEIASENTLSEVGYDFLNALADPAEWAATPEIATALQAETFEILHLVDREPLWSGLRDLASPFEHLEALEKGAALTVENIDTLRGWMITIDAWADFPLDGLNSDSLRKAIQSMPSVRDPLREVDRVIAPTGEIIEKATPRLARVSSEIRELRKVIAQKMESVLKDYADQGILQETYSDVHDGRYVLPVKVGSQSQIEGMITSRSASRQTVFIEPAEVALLNNQLRNKEHEREDEIFQILEKLCGHLRPFAGEIVTAVETLGYWDHVRAKGALANVYGGKKIVLNSEGKIRLHQTAHPLLWWAMKPADIIRNDIDFGPPTRTILLTGPNTGGKTVFLKTLGLAGIFAKCGFLFPGTESQTVPFFSSVFVDLGDPQSIEEHLSSFSGHISRFRHILEEVNPDSLVLLDELNSATDPSEGAALGRAFLETVMNRGALVVATTHDPQLKAAATEDKRILNASMAFDEGARSPTFRLRFGVVGRSRALETAERLGLPAEVLTLARKFLSEEHLRLESVLTRLERDSDSAQQLKREAQRLKDEAEQLKKEWTETQKKNLGEIYEKMRAKMRGVLESAQDEVRAHVRALAETKSHRAVDVERAVLNDSFRASLERLDNVLQEEAPELARDLEMTRERAPEAAPEYNVGDLVRVPKWKSIGKILSIDGDTLKLQLGLIQVSLKKNEVDSASTAEKSTFAQQKRSEKTREERKAAFKSMMESVPDQIDLRGKRHDDAMAELEAYLDQAARSERVMVTIVHGLGTGALRESTRKLLKRLPYVKSVADGGHGAGGSGATKVEFDR